MPFNSLSRPWEGADARKLLRKHSVVAAPDDRGPAGACQSLQGEETQLAVEAEFVSASGARRRYGVGRQEER